VTTTPEVPLAPPVLLPGRPPAGYVLVHDQHGEELTRRPLLLGAEFAEFAEGFEGGLWQVTAAATVGLPVGTPLRVSLYDEVGMLVDSVVVEVAADLGPAWRAFGDKVSDGARAVLADETFDGDRVARAAAYLLDLVGVNIARGVPLEGEVARRVTMLANVLAERIRAEKGWDQG